MPKAETRSKTLALRMAGVELYFDDLARAKDFYSKTLGLRVKNEAAGHFVNSTRVRASSVWSARDQKTIHRRTKPCCSSRFPNWRLRFNRWAASASFATSRKVAPAARPGPCFTIPKATISCCSRLQNGAKGTATDRADATEEPSRQSPVGYVRQKAQAIHACANEKSLFASPRSSGRAFKQPASCASIQAAPASRSRLATGRLVLEPPSIRVQSSVLHQVRLPSHPAE